jgi:hypothetical protein
VIALRRILVARDEQASRRDGLTTREEPLVKIYVDTTGITFTVAKKSQPKVDEKGNQRSERGTGRPMWQTQVVALDETGGEVINVTTVGEIPSVEVGQFVAVEALEAKAWATNGRNGTAFRAASLTPLTSTSASK